MGKRAAARAFAERRVCRPVA